MLAKHILTVKRQLTHYTNELDRFTPDHPRYRPDKVALYQRIADDLAEVLDYLLERQRRAEARLVTPRNQPDNSPQQAVPAQKPLATASQEPSLAAGYDDLSDLPPELLKELSEGAKGEKDLLLKIIEERGGTANLDEILIDLWRKHKEIGKRPILANRLYRLSRRELCWPVPGKRGFYTTIKPEGAADKDDSSEKEEGPDAATSGPSNEMGAAGSPVGLPKSAPNGSIPFASTPIRRKLMSETSALANRLPFEQGGVK